MTSPTPPDAKADKNGWMPIETAPRDGTGILISLKYGGNYYRYVARWHQELARWTRDETSSALFPEHMQDWFKWWQPLPTPPVEGA